MSLHIPGTWAHPSGAQPESPSAPGAGQVRKRRVLARSAGNSLQGSQGRNGIPAEKPSLSRLLVRSGRLEHREQLAEPCDSQGPPARGPGYGRVQLWVCAAL